MTGGKRNADRTKERILRAAIAEFAAHGYSGARIDRIRHRARANARMIYHYFGDKDRLYVAVLEHVIGDLRQEELRLEVDQIDPQAHQGWIVLARGAAHHLDTEAERASFIGAGLEPWIEGVPAHFIRVNPTSIWGNGNLRA